MNRSDGGSLDQTTMASGPAAAGSDFLHLDPAEAPAGGLTTWLTDALREAILDGRLPPGSRLPASRTLAVDLHVSRGVVTEAYRRLNDDGQVTGHGRGGTVVAAARATPTARMSARPPAPRAPGPGAGPGPGPFGSPADEHVFELLRHSPAPIDLTPGVPDLAAFPRAAWLRAERTVLDRLTSADLGYGDPRGAPALREEVARWLARTRGIRVHADEVLIVAGVSQALGLLAQVLEAEGVGEIAVEDPGSLGVRKLLNAWRLRTPAVPVDDEGISVEALDRIGARAALLTPAHQFPTGVVLSGARRRELLRWADGGRLVVEDDYDAEHRYDRPPVPALHSLRPEQVCYTGSVSKLLAPALRLGWVIAPSRHARALTAAKRHSDLGNAALPQLVLARLMATGELERHLRLLGRRHRRRRDAMIAAVRAHLPGAVVHGAAAGLHLMITVDPPDLADTELAAEALRHGVKVQPLSWHAQRPQRPGLVLGYAACHATGIAAGVAAIGTALRALGAETSDSADGRPRRRSAHGAGPRGTEDGRR